ncbi:hypothetical protein 5 [Diadegma semiclausum ichnovirus]|nr:hypothetical protein 5 [Diadegma semiclausum ichnovirus]
MDGLLTSVIQKAWFISVAMHGKQVTHDSCGADKEMIEQARSWCSSRSRMEVCWDQASACWVQHNSCRSVGDEDDKLSSGACLRDETPVEQRSSR